MSRSIALAGMPGSGKSTIARLLADRLGRGLADTDVEIARHVGMSIPRIFAERGEAWFRAAEREVVREVARYEDLVIALGGGAVLDDANLTDLLLTGIVVHLDVPVEVLVERLATDGDGDERPLLAGDLPERLRELHTRRAPAYAEAADVVIDAARPAEVVVDDLLETLMGLGDVLTPSEHEQVMT